MSKLINDFNNMKHDLQYGINKVGKTIKNTANELKYDAQGALHTMNSKKDELVDKYDDNGFGKKIEKQIKKIKK